MLVEIISDIICPWCFIGKRRFERALAKLPQERLEIRWQPFQLNPTMPADGMERQSYMATKFGGADRAELQNKRIHETGMEVDINFNFSIIKRTPNTINSHRLIHYAHEFGLQNEIVEALFLGYFIQGRDLGAHDELIRVGASCGLNEKLLTRYLYSDEGRSHILDSDQKVRLSDISGVPCYVIDNKYAVSGAQSPEVFHQVFNLAFQESSENDSKFSAD